MILLEGKDEYIDFYNTKIKTADILVWAGAITDRYLSAKWASFICQLTLFKKIRLETKYLD
jgi:hypothetical protein